MFSRYHPGTNPSSRKILLEKTDPQNACQNAFAFPARLQLILPGVVPRFTESFQKFDCEVTPISPTDNTEADGWRQHYFAASTRCSRRYRETLCPDGC